MYSFLSGLSEPVGAIVIIRFLDHFNDVTFGILFAAVAGIMVFIYLTSYCLQLENMESIIFLYMD